MAGASWALALFAGCGDDAGNQAGGPSESDASAAEDAGPAGAVGGAGTGAKAGTGGSAGTAPGGGSGGTSGTGGTPVEGPTRPIPPGACRPSGPPSGFGSVRSVLYSGPRELGALAVRRGQVFVLDPADGLLRLPEGATEFERAVAGTVEQFLIADLNLYWSRDKGLWRASVAATDAIPDAVATQLNYQVALLRFDSTHLYFADPQARVLLRAPITDGALETIATGVQANDQVLQSGFVYFADAVSAQIRRVKVEGGTVEPVATGGGSAPTAVVTDGKTVFFTDGFAVMAAPVDGSTQYESLAVGGPGPAADRPARIEWLELAGKRLYFTDSSGDLGWIATDGSECGLIVQAAGTLAGADIDADGEAAYLSVQTGSAHELWRLTLK